MKKILDSIKFEKVHPSKKETIELFRLPTKKGCVEFVKLSQKHYEPHKHQKVDARLYVLEGSGKIILNGKPHKYKRGSIFNVPRGTSHGFEISLPTIFLSIQNKAILNKKTGKMDLEY